LRDPFGDNESGKPDGGGEIPRPVPLAFKGRPICLAVVVPVKIAAMLAPALGKAFTDIAQQIRERNLPDVRDDGATCVNKVICRDVREFDERHLPWQPRRVVFQVKGDTAAKLADHVTCKVIVVKPHGRVPAIAMNRG